MHAVSKIPVPFGQRLARVAGLAAISLLAFATRGEAQTFTFSPTIAGNYAWTTSANWGGVSFPNGIDVVANFANSGAVSQTLTFGQSITVGTINFNGTDAHTLNAGGGSLFLDTSGGSSIITVGSGAADQIINAPITVADDHLQITQNSLVGSLTLSALTMPAARTISIGGVGRTNIGALSSSGALTINNTSSSTPGEVHLGTISVSGTLTFTGTAGGSAARTILDGDSSLGNVVVDAQNVVQLANSGITWTSFTLSNTGATLEFADGVTIGTGNNLTVDTFGSAKQMQLAASATAATFNGNIADQDNQTLNFLVNAGQTLTLGGTYADSVGGAVFDKLGTGVLVFTNTLSLSGTAQVFSGGTVRFLASTGFGTGTLSLRPGTVELGDLVTITGALLHRSGASAIALTSDATSATYAGKFTMSSSTAMTMNVANSGQTLTISGDIDGTPTGTGGFNKTGAGVLVFSGANNYTLGTITVSAGRLDLNSAATYSNLLVTSSGTLRINHSDITWSTLSLISASTGTGATVELGNGVTVKAGNTLSISQTGNDKTLSLGVGAATYAGNIFNSETNNAIHLAVGSGATLSLTGTLGGAGTYDIAKEGTGRLVLAGPITYTFGTSGELVLNAGTVALNSVYTLPRVVLNGSSTLEINAATTISTLTLSGTSQLAVNAATTLSSTIVNAAALQINSTLANNVTWSTLTLIGSGTSLRVENGLTFNSGTITISLTGAEKTISLAVGATTGTITSPITHFDNDTLRLVADTGQTLTFTGAITGSNATSGGMIKLGAGTVVLTSTSHNYVPAVGNFFMSIDAGTLRIAAGGLGPLRLGGDGATLELSNGATVSDTLTISSTGTDKFLSIAPGAAAATFAGSITQADGDPLHLVAGSGQTFTISGAISNTTTTTLGGMIKDGLGRVVLSNVANPFTNTWTITAGILEVKKLADAGVVSSLGTGSLTGSVLNAPITLAGGMLLYSGSGDSTNRLFNVTNSGSIANDGSGTLSFTGTISGRSNATLTFAGSNDIFVAAALSQSAGTTLGVTKTGSGTLTLSGTNIYTGPTTVLAGVFHLSGSLAAGSSVTVSGGSLRGNGTVNGATTLSGGTISLGSGGQIANTLNVTDGGTWSGLGGVTGLITQNSGTFDVVSGASLNNAGGYALGGGLLNANGTLGGDVTVSGGTLGGSGTISGTVTVNSGDLSPGNSPGTLTLGDLDMNGGDYLWQLGTLTTSGPGTNFDFVLVNAGDADLSNAANVVLDFSLLATLDQPGVDNAFWLSDHIWTILSVTGGGLVNGTFADLNQVVDLGGFGSGVFSLGYDTTNVFLQYNVAAVPEPGSLLLATLGALSFGGYGWRKRKAKT